MVSLLGYCWSEVCVESPMLLWCVLCPFQRTLLVPKFGTSESGVCSNCSGLVSQSMWLLGGPADSSVMDWLIISFANATSSLCSTGWPSIMDPYVGYLRLPEPQGELAANIETQASVYLAVYRKQPAATYFIPLVAAARLTPDVAHKQPARPLLCPCLWVIQ